MDAIRKATDMPLVVIGTGDQYEKLVRLAVQKRQLNDRVIFLSDSAVAKTSSSFQNAADFPAIYQLATAMIYPSIFEGFGIPVLEALASELPVITSNLSCLPEAGGPGSLLIDPYSSEAIVEAMLRIVNEPDLIQTMKATGKKHADLFTPDITARRVMDLYETL